MLEGIGAVRPVGIHHRHGAGQLLLALVVIRHHHIHAKLGGIRHLLHAGDAAVHGDDQRDPLLMQGAHGLRRQAVSVLDAAGNIVAHLPAAAAQIVHQNGGGGDAVHVVVAENGDMLPFLQSGADAADGAVHVLHEKRRKGQRIFNIQKFGGSGAVGDAVGGQNGRQQRRIARRLQRLHRGSRSGKVPFFKFHARLPSFFAIFGAEPHYNRSILYQIKAKR